jgi:hypothetical protein
MQVIGEFTAADLDEIQKMVSVETTEEILQIAWRKDLYVRYKGDEDGRMSHETTVA